MARPFDYVVSLGPAPTSTPTADAQPADRPDRHARRRDAATPTPSPANGATDAVAGADRRCATPRPLVSFLSDATQEIHDSGLAVGFVFPSTLAGDPTDARVAEQFPAAGSRAARFAGLTLYVKGPADTCP